jgi:hypothetical protein
MMQQGKFDAIQVRTAKTLSVILHPLLIPVYGLLVIFTAPTMFFYLPFKIKEILFFILLINNVLIPVSLLPFLRFRYYMNPGIVNARKERLIPLLALSVLYGITSFIMSGLHVPIFLKVYSYSITFLAVALFLVNLRWRISLFSAGAGFLTALVIVLSLKMSSGLPWFMVSALLLSGLILSARLRLNAHSPLEVYLGYISGLTVLISFMFIFQ